MVVVDNDGGGIFSFLAQASTQPGDRFERFWGTPHGLDLAAVASAYGAEVVEVTSRASFDGFVAGAGKAGVRVGIVRSDRAANVAAHDAINEAVARSLSRQ